MSKKDNIVNLDDFRAASEIKKREEAVDANFTADERRALEGAFEYGRTIGAFSNARMDSNRKMSFYHIEIANGKRTTLNISKRNALGNFSYAIDNDQQGNLESCRDFKSMVKAIYDFATAVAPEKSAVPTPKI